MSSAPLDTRRGLCYDPAFWSESEDSRAALTFRPGAEHRDEICGLFFSFHPSSSPRSTALLWNALPRCSAPQEKLFVRILFLKGLTNKNVHGGSYVKVTIQNLRYGIPLFHHEQHCTWLSAVFQSFGSRNYIGGLNIFTGEEEYYYLCLCNYGESYSPDCLVVRIAKTPESFKSWTARQIVDKFAENGHAFQLAKLRMAKNKKHTDSDHQVWQEDFFPKQIIGDSMMIQKMEYIHNNPVKREFVDRPEHWRYSSARNYLGMEGMIPVTLFGR